MAAIEWISGEKDPQALSILEQRIAETGRALGLDRVWFREVFDGIWACASLLHVPRQSMAQTRSTPAVGGTKVGLRYLLPDSANLIERVGTLGRWSYAILDRAYASLARGARILKVIEAPELSKVLVACILIAQRH